MWRDGSRISWKSGFKSLAALLILVSSFIGLNPGGVQAKGSSDVISLAQLPVQGRDMMSLIREGGPFKYEKDGAVFGNRERLLPASPRGFYREYTVRTPGERSRGARRIVCGGLKLAAPEACYYTDDHYASFRKIVP